MTSDLALFAPTDLAGPFSPQPTLGLISQRIRHLVGTYVTAAILRDRLEDLPRQWQCPRLRPWSGIPWSAVHPSQIGGIALPTFCALLLGIINTEAPIRGYTQSSRQYLEPLYPSMARFVGGRVNSQGTLIEVGLWEREEKRHTPALVKLYTCLTGEKPPVQPHAARPYRPAADPRENLYRHGLHRVATEYGAACLYLWMMAHTTGATQTLLAELLIDEINHMTKFWGFGVWAYPQTSWLHVSTTLSRALMAKIRTTSTQGSLFHTLARMTGELAWAQWSLSNRLTFLYACDQVIKPLWQWHQSLTPAYLNHLFGEAETPFAPVEPVLP